MEFYRDLAPGHRRLLAGHVALPDDLTRGKTRRQKPFSERYTRRADPVSSIVKEHASSTRYRAVSMVNGGLTQVQVTKQLKVEPRTLKSGMAFDRRGGMLDNRRDRERKTAKSRVANNIRFCL